MLKEVYTSSASLQYAQTLQTTAYLDVPFQAPPYTRPYQSNGSESPTGSEDESMSDHRRSTSDALDEDVTKVRKAPFVEKPLSAAEKRKLLEERESRWDNIQAKCIRKFMISGPAGVYELQEGIFLLCTDYSDTDDGRVSDLMPATCVS